MGDDLGVGSIKFSVTRAFQQDQIVLLGIEIDVKSYLSQECQDLLYELPQIFFQKWKKALSDMYSRIQSTRLTERT